MSRMSGESYGPISADYFTGRRVEKVENGDGAEGSPEWTITFEGGGLIHNYEPETPRPTSIVGAALTMTILNSTDKTTKLLFGMEEVVLNPVKWSMVDVNYTKGHEVFPQTSAYNELPSTPEDPSPSRIADGPTLADEIPDLGDEAP